MTTWHMKFSFALSKKFNPSGVKKHLTEANIIFGGALFLAMVFLALMAVDAYLFYAARGRESGAPPPSASPPAFTPQDIDEAIKLIDQRAQEYQALLEKK